MKLTHQVNHPVRHVNLKALVPEVTKVLGLSMWPLPHGQQALRLEEGQVVAVHGLVEPLAHAHDHLQQHSRASQLASLHNKSTIRRAGQADDACSSVLLHLKASAEYLSMLPVHALTPCTASTHRVIHSILVQVPGPANPEDVGDLAELHVQLLQHTLQLSGLHLIADVLGGAALAGKERSSQPLLLVPAAMYKQADESASGDRETVALEAVYSKQQRAVTECMRP